MTDNRDDLSPAEQSAMAALPREADLPAGMEDRIVGLLRQHGHLPTPITAARGATRRVSPAWLTGALAASLALFASGLAVGMVMGQRGALQVFQATRTTAEMTARVQVAGAHYVEALAALSQLPPNASPAARDSVRTVALRVLGEAAQEMALLAPDDPLAAAVLRGLNARSRQGDPAAPSRSVVWY